MVEFKNIGLLTTLMNLCGFFGLFVVVDEFAV